MARKRGVDRPQVVDAAVAVVEADGLGALTLARVADELGVRPPSLYSHVANLAGLRGAVAIESARRLGAALAEAAVVGGRAQDGGEALRAIAGAYRAFAVEHAGLYAAMLPVPRPEEPEGFAAFASPLGVVASVLDRLGVPAADSVGVVRAFRSALHGFVSLEAGGGFGMPIDVDASFELLVDLLVAGVLARAGAPPGRAGEGH